VFNDIGCSVDLFVNLSAVGLSDPEAKEKYLLSLMESMPEPNHSTVVYLIDHLIR